MSTTKYRGTLLKPSQRNGKGSRTGPKLSRYERLKETIRNWCEDRFKVGAALLEIREQKLYQEEHETFEAFCEAEYGFKIKMSPIGDKITNEGQARALASVPAEERKQVVSEAVAAGGKVTAKAITEAKEKIVEMSPIGDKKEKKQEVVDKTGYPIPETVLELWNRAEEFNSNLQSLTRIKSEISKGLDDQDPIFRELNNSVIAKVQNLYAELKCVIPYAVCTSCQGHQKESCGLCGKRGFISRFAYKQFVPVEIKEFREKARTK